MIYNNLPNLVINEMTLNNLAYHNVDHARKVVKYLEDRKYDRYLILAAQYHDVIYDKYPDKEYRSSVFMENELMKNYRGSVESYFMYKDCVNKAKLCIMATVNHSCRDNPDLTWPLIRADLDDLTRPYNTIRNWGLIMEESMELYDADEFTVANNNITFMEKLLKIAGINAQVDSDHREFWFEVQDGCQLTINLSKEIL